MLHLLLASLIWAFSFGLLGNILTGVSPAVVAVVRLALAALVFMPLLRRLPLRDAACLMAMGAVQFGLMYLCYNASFAFLPSHQVALLTAVTPLYVILLADVEQHRVAWGTLLAAGLAVAGAAVVVGCDRGAMASLQGVLLVQASNLCFAIGQLAYRRWARSGGTRPPDHALMGWLYMGGALAAMPWAILASLQGQIAPSLLTARQGAALVYLGLVASGLGFFLWNAGARRSAPGVLAVFNNAKIPLAAAVSLLVFGEHTDLPRLLVGGGMLLAAMVLCHVSTAAAPLCRHAGSGTRVD